MSVKREILNDRRYLRAKRGLETLQDSLNATELMEELFTLQPSRGVSALKRNAILQSSVTVLVESSVQEIAVRSRVTSIKMDVLRNLLKVEELMDPLRKYILLTYGSEMRKEGNTRVADMKSAVDSYLNIFVKQKRTLEYIIKIADLIIEDVDSAGWGLKRISDVLESTKRDR